MFLCAKTSQNPVVDNALETGSNRVRGVARPVARRCVGRGNWLAAQSSTPWGEASARFPTPWHCDDSRQRQQPA